MLIKLKNNDLIYDTFHKDFKPNVLYVCKIDRYIELVYSICKVASWMIGILVAEPGGEGGVRGGMIGIL